MFGYTQARTNSLGNWFWAADAVVVVVFGALSDRLGVRKPIMVGAGLVAAVMTLIFASRAAAPATSYATFVMIISILSFQPGRSVRTVDGRIRRDGGGPQPGPRGHRAGRVGVGPARRGRTVSFLVLPVVIDSVTPITDYGPQLQALAAAYPAQVAALRTLGPATRAGLRATPPASAAVARAVREIESADHVGAGAAARDLLALRSVPGADRAYLNSHSQAVEAAKATAPGQWRTWWWVCAAGQVAFLPTVFLLRGRWRRSKALREGADHYRQVAGEMAVLTAGAVRDRNGVTGGIPAG